MNRWSRLAVLAAVLLLPCAAMGEIYGWVDENGVKHYSNNPPPEGIEVFTQTAEIQTDEAQLRQIEESDQQDLEEPENQPPDSEEPSGEEAGAPTEATAPGTGVVEEDEREAFHRDRIKQRTRQNTSPVPRQENRMRDETPQIQPVQPVEGSDAARQNPRVERKQNQP